MRDELISMFIDDEMDLDDKMEFVEQVHIDRTFKEQTLEFLQMEKDLRSEVTEHTPAVTLPAKRIRSMIFRPMPLAAAFAVATAVFLVFLLQPAHQEVRIPSETYRFVIYRPDASRAEITGDFTGWERVPMQRIGSSGYWELSYNIRPGEHRYVYILDGDKRIADPTVPIREKDDYGSENSILMVGVHT
jgi:hypothetical protein